MRELVARTLLAAATLATVSCGNAVGPVGTPDAPIWDDPTRARVSVSKKMTEPFVIDWENEQRTALEIVLRKGPAIVRFDEKSFELLPNCTAEGVYEYNGVTPKKDAKVWRSRSELHVNLPAGAVNLEGRLREEGSVRVAVFIVGQSSLAGEVRREQLRGECQGATHVVRRVTLGAFRMMSGASRAGNAQVDAFGYGADGSGEGSSGIYKEDGNFQECNTADPDSPKAPPRCRAVLQVLVVPLDQAAPAPAATSVAGPPRSPAEDRPECGDGMRWDGSGCVSIERVRQDAERGAASGDANVKKGYECEPTNAQECLDQCKVGNLGSCVHVGWHLMSGQGGLPKDEAKALNLWHVACKAREGRACTALNVYYGERGDHRKALIYATAGCQYGDAGSCTNAGVQAFFGRGTQQNRGTALKLWLRACKMRDFQACANAGVIIMHGMAGVTKDQGSARKLYEKACASPGKEGCPNLAGALELGLGGPKDTKRALELYMEMCERGIATSCVGAGMLIEEHSDKPEHLRRALGYYEKGCAVPPNGGCLSEREMRESLPGVYSDEGYDRRACEASTQNVLACYNAGIAHERGYGGSVDTSKATEYLQKACQGQLQKACRSPRPGMPRRM